ncbi:MAG TPA: glycosyltransferase family 87 protein [Candidatus Dormibacteraeota bacterium]|nr:glycosyltransferase family 87 protein [Candidatus Dormibacteraeota bacterium]
MLAVALAFFIYPLLPVDDVISSDWPAFDTGARIVVADPGHLYDLDVQQRVQQDVTGGRVLATLGIHGILPFLAPAWVALLVVPFDPLGPDLGGRAWVLFGLVCLLGGLYFATRPRPPSEFLPALAGVPTAVMMLNAQLDGVGALGIGAAIALWSQPYLAGLALGLTLMKPQLVLPLGAAILVTGRWKVLAGWAAAGVVLLLPTLALNPHWISDWLGQTRATVAAGSREVDLPHLGVLLPDPVQTVAVAALTVIAIALVLYLARRRRHEFPAAAAVLISGGVLAAPHALPADLVLVGFGLAVWGQARWFDWLTLSVGALICALMPAPIPAFVGMVVIGWCLLRSAGFVISRSPEPERAPAR